MATTLIFSVSGDLSANLQLAGLHMRDNVGAVKTLEFVLENATLAISERVTFTKDATGLFYGIVTEQTINKIKDGYYLASVNCQDISARLYSNAWPYTASFTATTEKDILTAILASLPAGVTVGAYCMDGDAVDIDFTELTPAEAIRNLAAINGRIWYIDTDLELHYFMQGDELAPFGISDNPDNINTFGCIDLRYTSLTDQVENAAVFHGSFTCFEPGLVAGQAIQIDDDTTGIHGEFYIFEVETEFAGPGVFKWHVAFNSGSARPAARLSERLNRKIGADDDYATALDPVEPNDVATKRYVDNNGGGGLLTATKNLTTANWQSGAATSGNPGADLLTIGADGTPTKIQSLWIDTTNLEVGANIIIRAYTKINNVEVDVYSSWTNGNTFVKGLDTTGLWLFNGTICISNACRIEISTDKAADNGKDIGYEYLVES